MKPSSVADDNASPDTTVVHPWLSLPLLPEVTVTILRKSGNSPIPLFLAAPIQGTADPLLEVAQNLDRPVYGLQYPPDLPCQTITRGARALVQVSYNVISSASENVFLMSCTICVGLVIFLSLTNFLSTTRSCCTCTHQGSMSSEAIPLALLWLWR